MKEFRETHETNFAFAVGLYTSPTFIKERWKWENIWWKLGQEKRKICTFAEYNLSANKKIIIIWNG